MKEFLESLLDQDLEPNFRPKSPCKCPKLAKIVDKHKAQQAHKHKAPNFDSSQEREGTTDDNIPLIVKKMQAQPQKWPKPQHTHRRVNIKSDCSDLDNGKDNQRRSIPVVVDITSDHEMDIDQQPSSSISSTSTPLRRPNTLPRALDFGRGRGNFPPANWTSVTKGCECGFINGHDKL